MNKTLKWKIALLICMLLIAGVILTPSLYKGAPKRISKYIAPEGLNLGLDLQGGMHLVLKVDLKKPLRIPLILRQVISRKGWPRKR